MKGWSKAMMGVGGWVSGARWGWPAAGLGGVCGHASLPVERQSWSRAPAKGDPRVLPAAVKPGQP